MSRRKYTVFCQESSGTGTIWIDMLTADKTTTMESIAARARKKCARDWECDPEDVHCLGVARGNVQIAYWEDL